MDKKIFSTGSVISRIRNTACRINALWIVWKYKMGLWLEDKLSGYSKGRAILLFVLCCSTVTSVLALQIANSFDANNQKRIQVRGISKLKNIHPRIQTVANRPTKVPKELQKVRRFLDSLANDPSGRTVYDSITGVRPGLLDSLRQAEYYYREMN